MRLLVPLLLVAGVAQSQTIEGLYRPVGPEAASWSCNPDDLGMDLGALGILDNKLYGLENTCDLTDPRERDGGTQFLAICSGEGENYSKDTFIAPTDTGVSLTSDGKTINWRRCDSTSATAPTNEWVQGFGMGVTETTTRDPLGNDVMLTCTGGQDGKVFVEFLGVPAAGGPITFEVDDNRFEMTVWADGGRLNLDCRVCADNYTALWQALRSGSNLIITQGSNQARFSLRGSATALDPVPCLPEVW